jgi:hypothetical protein
MDTNTPTSGLKARNQKAQGNALGAFVWFGSSPERATQQPHRHFVLPLQGKCILGAPSRGVTPGCHVVALSASQKCDVKPLEELNYFRNGEWQFATLRSQLALSI